ncbi:FMN-binding negative transcriptional regulator [Azotobacter sp. CWF10]
MFTPRAFAETDLLWLDRLLARDPFVTVLTAGSDGLPELTRMPVLYRREGERIELRGHWARANPQSRHSGAAKVLVDGPHGYVSASWYPDKEPAARVPTWNYAAAELRGQLHTFDDADALAGLVGAISDHFEASVGQARRFDATRAEHGPELRAIVGFVSSRTRAAEAEAEPEPSRRQPARRGAELEQLGTPSSTELAQWMRWHREQAARSG